MFPTLWPWALALPCDEGVVWASVDAAPGTYRVSASPRRQRYNTDPSSIGGELAQVSPPVESFFLNSQAWSQRGRYPGN